MDHSIFSFVLYFMSFDFVLKQQQTCNNTTSSKTLDTRMERDDDDAVRISRVVLRLHIREKQSKEIGIPTVSVLGFYLLLIQFATQVCRSYVVSVLLLLYLLL